MFIIELIKAIDSTLLFIIPLVVWMTNAHLQYYKFL